MAETQSAIVSRARRGRGTPAIYVGLAGEAPRTAPARVSLRGVDLVELGRGDARRIDRTEATVRVALADGRVSSRHARLSRVGGTWVVEDLGSKNGTWIAGQRVRTQPLVDGDALLLGHTALVFRDHGGEEVDLDGPVTARAPGLETVSPALAARFAELARAAQAPVPIEITGETGTGKELVARAIHVLSRRAGPFVAVNCGAIPVELVESELFGHTKGAYTGADGERLGRVRAAAGGTLLLDEIAELPPTSQAALLRVLQEGEVVPVGADRPIRVDVRIVTATHKRLDAELEAGRFRADLRARLLGFAIALPPLRERREDLGLLTTSLLDRLAPGREITFAADAVGALCAHAWPLNVRELERALAGALAVARDRIELDHLPASLRSRAEAPAEVDLSTLSRDERALRETLTASIARHDGNLAAVARELGKDRTQIRRWMKRFGISRDDTDD